MSHTCPQTCLLAKHKEEIVLKDIPSSNEITKVLGAPSFTGVSQWRASQTAEEDDHTVQGWEKNEVR